MLVYRAIRWVRESFPIIMLFVYLGMAVFSLPFVFMMPQLTLVLFAFGLASLPFSLLTSKLLGWSQRLVARAILRRGFCPACGKRMQSHRDPARVWSCEFCDARFRPDGVEERAETGTLTSEGQLA